MRAFLVDLSMLSIYQPRSASFGHLETLHSSMTMIPSSTSPYCVRHSSFNHDPYFRISFPVAMRCHQKSVAQLIVELINICSQTIHSKLENAFCCSMVFKASEKFDSFRPRPFSSIEHKLEVFWTESAVVTSVFGFHKIMTPTYPQHKALEMINSEE